MTKLQALAELLQEAVEKIEWHEQAGFSRSLHRQLLVLRNLVPPLLEEIGKQGWISVEDGLPEPGVQVIVAHKNGGSFVATAMVHSKQRGEWVHCHDPNWPFAGRVTLWQPLPKPPEITSSGEKK